MELMFAAVFMMSYFFMRREFLRTHRGLRIMPAFIMIIAVFTAGGLVGMYAFNQDWLRVLCTTIFGIGGMVDFLTLEKHRNNLS